MSPGFKVRLSRGPPKVDKLLKIQGAETGRRRSGRHAADSDHYYRWDEAQSRIQQLWEMPGIQEELTRRLRPLGADNCAPGDVADECILYTGCDFEFVPPPTSEYRLWEQANRMQHPPPPWTINYYRSRVRRTRQRHTRMSVDEGDELFERLKWHQSESRLRRIVPGFARNTSPPPAIHPTVLPSVQILLHRGFNHAWVAEFAGVPEWAVRSEARQAVRKFNPG